MKIWKESEELGARVKKATVTVGNFDGVHQGHRLIVEHLLAMATRQASESVAILFDPHPSVVLGGAPRPILTTPPRRVELMTELGVDHCLVLPFSPTLARTRAEAFIRKLHVDLGMVGLCVGENTHVGHEREGTPARLQEMAQVIPFELEVAPPKYLEGGVVSSSRIRSLVQEGEVDQAALLLGRTHRTSGHVVRGSARGTGLGFPTANLQPEPTLLPARGVYATYARVEDKRYPSVTNIGLRPTMGEADHLIIETHLFGFSQDLFGSRLEVEWVKRLRQEKKFGSVDELVAQIHKDAERAKALLQPL